MKKYLFVLMVLMFAISGCSDQRQTERLLQHFLDRHEARVKPIVSRYYEAEWNAHSGKTTFSELLNESRLMDSMYMAAGKPAEYYQNLLNNVYGNTSDLEVLQKIKDSGFIVDSLLKRQFIKVFREYVSISNNWDNSDKQMANLFSQFYELKRDETAFWDSINKTDSPDAQKQWVERFSGLSDNFRGVIKALNEDSRKMGYQNYYQLNMDFSGVDYNELNRFVDLVEAGTHRDFERLMKQVYIEVCKNNNISELEIEPQLVDQEFRKMVIPAEWDSVYSKDDFMSIIRDFYGMGNFNIDDIYANSDIWMDEGKITQSFFFCLDFEKEDYRIYSNSEPNTYGFLNMLHEFGHAVHYKSVNRSTPYFLTEPHPITAEAVGIYFGNKLYHSDELHRLMGIEERPQSIYFEAFSDPASLVFIRKMIRNIHFEKAIFENPDQDFNQLWWSLTEKYLFEKSSNKDQLPVWISNYHVLSLSGIHVAYLYATAFAAQLEASYPNGNFSMLKERLLQHGDTMPWDRLVEISTGEKLDLNYLFNLYRRKKISSKPIHSVVTDTRLMFTNNIQVKG